MSLRALIAAATLRKTAKVMHRGALYYLEHGHVETFAKLSTAAVLADLVANGLDGHRPDREKVTLPSDAVVYEISIEPGIQRPRAQ